MASEWISVEERMPEVDGQYYLVCDIETGEYLPDRGLYEDGEWYVEGDSMFVVTHWMPLPEPPEVK